MPQIDVLFKGDGIVNKIDQKRDVFVAIADPTRRKLIRILAEAEEMPLHKLTEQFQLGRTAVSKHLTILKEANLVINRKAGRETRYRLNPAPLKEVKDWLSFYEKFWNERAILLKNLLED
jgi:DNA-binding transcriptional ArsR family regulator